MGITYSQLSNDTALSVITKFIIIKESGDLFWTYWDSSENVDKRRQQIILRLLFAGLILDISRQANYLPRFGYKQC